MTVLDHIRADAITARKARAAAAGVLVALLGEIETKTKSFSPARPITDAEVLAIVKRFLDGAAETEATLINMPDSERKTEALAKVATERAALIAYMPIQMSEGDIEAFAQAKKAEGMVMGAIMAALKADFPGGYDGKLASAVVKRVLA
jgi:uncharacterized protein YqeY